VARAFTDLDERCKSTDDPAARRLKLTEYLRALADEEVRVLTARRFERHWRARTRGAAPPPARPDDAWAAMRGEMLQWRTLDAGGACSADAAPTQ
jgi:hypothetical protein